MTQRATAKAITVDTPIDVVRPFAWLAAMAFAIGFWGYLAVAPLLGR